MISSSAANITDIFGLFLHESGTGIPSLSNFLTYGIISVPELVEHYCIEFTMADYEKKQAGVCGRAEPRFFCV